MLNALITFLGIKSWNYNHWFIRLNTINTEFVYNNKHLKSIKLLNLINDDTPSPKLNIFKLNKTKHLELHKRIIFDIYSFYFIFIFILMSLQPAYSLIFFLITYDINYCISFFININVPLITLWSKYYFKTNHLDLILKCKNYKTTLVLISTVISIIINFIDISSFHNEYYWPHLFENEYIFFLLVCIEWLYSRLYIFLLIYTFMYVINQHIYKLKKIITEIEENEFDFENNVCLSNIISRIASSRHEIELTISFYNNIISLITIFGGISLAIFIKVNFYNFNEINLENHDRYLIKPLILYIICQIILIFNIWRYAETRESLLKYVKSVNFIHRFLTRISTEKIMKKTNDINLVILNVLEETATTVDWVVLGNMLSEKWLDFTIFGISTSDGKLIKKSITIGGIILFILSFIQTVI